ncbi:hypothetical protein HMPREF3190_00229 [Umbribacter vaginalis]|nr:hypothetical protein HMPREF3190_00229 [Coriobacteriales bacterium DNF00809]
MKVNARTNVIMDGKTDVKQQYQLIEYVLVTLTKNLNLMLRLMLTKTSMQV